MKRLYIFFLFLIIQNVSSASDSLLVFNYTGYSSQLITAKLKKKKIMICILPDRCATDNCFKNAKEELFLDKNIGYFLNANFLNFKYDPFTIEGKKICKKFNLDHYPAFIFLNDSGSLIHKLIGEYPPSQFILEAQKALSGIDCLSDYSKRYRSGSRDADFLLTYCYALKNAGESDSNIINQYLNTQNNLNNDKNIKFIYDFAVVEFKPMISYGSSAFDFLYSNSDVFTRKFNKESVDIRILWILNSAVVTAIYNKDEITFSKILPLFNKYDNGKEYEWKNETGNVIGALGSTHLVSWNKMKFYESFGDEEKYKSAFESYANNVYDNWEDLNDLAWNSFEHASDTAILHRALKYSKHSVELNENLYDLDTYASLLYKLGEYKEALIQAEQALSDAKKNKKDLSHFYQLINKIKKRIK